MFSSTSTNSGLSWFAQGIISLFNQFRSVPKISSGFHLFDPRHCFCRDNLDVFERWYDNVPNMWTNNADTTHAKGNNVLLHLQSNTVFIPSRHAFSRTLATAAKARRYWLKPTAYAVLFRWKAVTTSFLLGPGRGRRHSKGSEYSNGREGYMLGEPSESRRDKNGR